MSYRFDRGQRRHHRERLIVRRFKEEMTFSSGSSNGLQWCYERARARARTATVCSCFLCGNPRRYRGNSQQALSLQELKMVDWRREIE